MKFVLCAIFAAALCAADRSWGQVEEPVHFEAVPELPYRVQPDFFELPNGLNFGEVSAVAVNSKGHIFLFQRVKPMLAEFDANGRFLRSLGEGLFDTPHGLRVDAEDNLWTTDVGSHTVLKLNPAGRVQMVLGRKGQGAEADWLFNRPADVAFDKQGNIYIADGYGNSRIMKFDKTGRFLKSWGSFGIAPGEFELPHAVVIDAQGRVYVGDRENHRIQIFDEDGKFLRQWTDVGYPYGLTMGPDGHLFMADGGYDRVVEINQDGKIVGALGEPGHAPGQFTWPHILAMGANKRIYVADILNWRVQVFVPTKSSGKMTSYIPSKRLFNDSKPSTGWTPRQTAKPAK